VLGIFARLWHRDGKIGYLDDLPLVLNYVLDACRRYPELVEFGRWLEWRVAPELPAANARQKEKPARRKAGPKPKAKPKAKRKPKARPKPKARSKLKARPKRKVKPSRRKSPKAKSLRVVRKTRKARRKVRSRKAAKHK
jgi:outer membrane biosynthesis protein TonB